MTGQDSIVMHGLVAKLSFLAPDGKALSLEDGPAVSPAVVIPIGNDMLLSPFLEEAKTIRLQNEKYKNTSNTIKSRSKTNLRRI